MQFESLMIISPIVAMLTYFVRKAFTRLDTTMSEQEIRTLIDDKLGPINANQRNIERELRRIDAKIDELLRIVIDEKGRRD